MAITYFNSASNPADNGTLAGPAVSVTPPGSMVAGDLVCMVAGYKGTGVTMAISATGGQTWTSETQAGGATSGLAMRLFWCRYNGTWSADPSVTITSGTNAMTVMMHVFRPSSGANTWSVSVAQGRTDSAASSSMTSASIQLALNDLGFAAVISNDDNTYTNGSGGDYTTSGTVQYRNLQGQDCAMGAQYRIEPSGAFSRQGAWNQATLGSDTYATLIIGFHETTVTVFIAQPPLAKLQAVKRSNHY